MDQIKYNNFIYRNSVHNGEYIIHNKIKPSKLFKYYAFSEYSVDALLRGYLFASHPFDLNDTLDSNYSLLTNIDQNIYNSLSTQFGIISLVGDSSNDLMWPHYTQERGFQIMTDRVKLEKSLKGKFSDDDRYLGLYPINYCSDVNTIEFKNERALAAFFYLTNVKLECWKYEKEWRIILSRPKMNFPATKHGLLVGGNTGKISNRQFFYDRSLIEQIVVGKHFFNGDNFIVEKTDDNKFKVKPRTIPYKQFVEYIYNNLKDKFYISDVNGILDTKTGNYKIVRSGKRFEIELIANDFYKLYRTTEELQNLTSEG